MRCSSWPAGSIPDDSRQRARWRFASAWSAGSSSGVARTLRRRARGIAVLRELATAPRLTRSDTERRVLKLLRDAELPPPETNVVVCGKEVDLFWRDAGLAIELDAFGTHGASVSFEDDRKVDVDLAAAGIEVRRFTRRRVVEHPHAVVARIAALLTLRLGGLPPPRRSA